MLLRSSHRSAFSLLEILIAVAILADLLLIAMPAYDRARKQAQNARFCADVRVAAAAFEMYSAENNRYPEEAAPQVLPPGMEQYLRGVNWSMRNSLGGVWDWDHEQGYAKAAVATETPVDMDDLQLADIDTRIDNGVLATGSFRERTAHRRWAYIIE